MRKIRFKSSATDALVDTGAAFNRLLDRSVQPGELEYSLLIAEKRTASKQHAHPSIQGPGVLFFDGPYRGRQLTGFRWQASQLADFGNH